MLSHLHRFRPLGWIALCLALVGLGGCRQHVDALERVRDTGVMRVALDPSFPPFEYIDEAGNLQGFDVEIARELARRLGVEARFVTTGYDALYDALITGNADVIISALCPDPSRTEDFAFSPPYFNAGEMLVVRQDSLINSNTDLAGRRLGVVFGTEGHMQALRWEPLLNPPVVLVAYETTGEILAHIENRSLDAGIVHNIAALGAVLNGRAIRVLDPPVSDEIYVIATQREDQQFVQALSEHLEAMYKDGTMQSLLQHWMR